MTKIVILLYVIVSYINHIHPVSLASAQQQREHFINFTEISELQRWNIIPQWQSTLIRLH